MKEYNIVRTEHFDVIEWIAPIGGVVDEVVDEATSIAMLVKTLWEVYEDEAKQEAIVKLFTVNCLEQAIAKSLSSLITSDSEQLQYKSSRAAVMLAFVFYSLAENAAKSLDDALQEAAELTKKVEHAPVIRAYLAEVSKLQKQGVPQTKQLKELFDKIRS